MSRADRAKQFAPFSALKGLEEAIAEKSERASKRRPVSEERARVLCDRLSRLAVGECVYVMYYISQKGYIKRHVRVYDVDMARRAILTDGEYIYFDDIYALRSLGEKD